MQRRASQGFTLIELMVALAMALAITSAAMTVLLVAVNTQKEGTLRNELTRDAQLVMDTIGRDLAYLGAGVPRGFEAATEGSLLGVGETSFNATTAQLDNVAGNQLRPPIRVGKAAHLSFIGDAPHPNAEINGIAAPGLFGGSHRPAVASELSPCGVPNSAGVYDCDTTAVSMIQEVGGAACTGGALTEPTCPWGLNKWQGSGSNPVKLVFAGVDGSWYRRAWDMSDKGDTSGRMTLHLEHSPSTGHDLPVERFIESGVGGGMIANLDRIVYSLEVDGGGSACGAEAATDFATDGAGSCSLYRRQCWGWNLDSLDPGDNDFPGVQKTAGLSTAAAFPASCTAPNDGTPWEKLMDDIDVLQFRYYAADAPGTPLAPAGTGLTPANSARARIVEVELVMRRFITGTNQNRDLSHRMVRRFWLENGGGLVSYPNPTSNSVGGCLPNAAMPNECAPQ